MSTIPSPDPEPIDSAKAPPPKKKFKGPVTIPIKHPMLDPKLSDPGNARRFMHDHKEFVHYVVEWRAWATWDGHKWKKDTVGNIIQRCIDTMDNFYYVADKLIVDIESKEKVKAFALRSQNIDNIGNTLKVVKTIPGVSISALDLDMDHWVLNTKNKIINLRTGIADKPNSKHLVTKSANVEFDENAKCPMFLEFINKIMSGDGEVIRYLQKALGYSLTGSVNAKAVFILHGKGDTGKSSFMWLIRQIMGDYGGMIMIDSLMQNSQNSSNASADLADLKGARFITTSESDEKHHLAEAKVKYLTSMDDIKTCRKYENPFSFLPTHKFFVDTNFLPTVSGGDDAIWSRLKGIHFKAKIPKSEMIDGLKDKMFEAEASGILNWMLEGCLAYQKEGLKEPKSIVDYTEEWKVKDDHYRDFFGEKVEFKAETFVEAKDMWGEFVEWCRDNGIKNPSRAGLADRLGKEGAVKAKLRDGGPPVWVWKHTKLSTWTHENLLHGR
jgi:putative DNA primase/helicase